MALDLVTGYKGTAHITAEDVGAFNAGIFGSGEYVLNSGNKFSASLTSNNTVKILDGDLMMQGRHVTLKKDTFEEVTIENGESGMNRIDLIVARYTKDSNTGVENVAFAVIKGTPASGTATEPEHTTGDILSGDCTLHEMPLYKVSLSGLTASEPEAIFESVNRFDNASFPFNSEEEATIQNWYSLGNGLWQIPNDKCKLIGLSGYNGVSLLNIVSVGASSRKCVCQLVTCLNGNNIYFRKGSFSNVSGKFGEWDTIHQNYVKPVATGSYEGTGLSGVNNPNTLTFNFFPNFILVKRGSDIMMAFRGNSSTELMSFAFGSNVSSSATYLNHVVWDGYYNKVSWYSESAEYGANHQSNIAGEVYYYFAC